MYRFAPRGNQFSTLMYTDGGSPHFSFLWGLEFNLAILMYQYRCEWPAGEVFID